MISSGSGMIYDSFYTRRSTAGTTYWYADQVMFLVHWSQSKLGYYSGAALATERHKRGREWGVCVCVCSWCTLVLLCVLGLWAYLVLKHRQEQTSSAVESQVWPFPQFITLCGQERTTLKNWLQLNIYESPGKKLWCISRQDCLVNMRLQILFALSPNTFLNKLNVVLMMIMSRLCKWKHGYFILADSSKTESSLLDLFSLWSPACPREMWLSVSSFADLAHAGTLPLLSYLSRSSRLL